MIGEPDMNKKLGIDLEKFKARLIDERDELQRLAKISEDERKPVILDQTEVGRLSRMDAIQIQAMAIETDRRRKVELQRIEAALQRLGEGEYGICVSCGKAIAKKRLENDPTAPTCITCAEK